MPIARLIRLFRDPGRTSAGARFTLTVVEENFIFMDIDTFVGTRTSLHAVAELLLAGPAYAKDDDIRLRSTPGGFGVWRRDGPRVDGADLVIDDLTLPIRGTIAALAAAASLTPRSLQDVYSGVVAIGVEEVLAVDPEAAAILADAFRDGNAALEAFAPEAERVLWPEHFDIGISVGEVNYGVSPGDSLVTMPYAYVGPWVVREHAFWNAPFGAARELSDFPDVGAVVEFFRSGQAAAANGRDQ